MKTVIEPTVDSLFKRTEVGRHPSHPVVERSWDAVLKLFCSKFSIFVQKCLYYPVINKQQYHEN